MSVNFLFLPLFLATSPFADAQKESLAISEFRIELSEFKTLFNNQKKDLELLQERLNSLSSTLDHNKDELGKANKADIESAKERLTSYDKRLASLETGQKSLISDLKTLKDHLNESEQALSKCEEKLNSLENTLSSDMKSLKGSLQSMMALLQKEPTAPTTLGTKNYIVQAGDSLGKIAQENHISLKRLKELNSLANDQIYPGQKLLLPENN